MMPMFKIRKQISGTRYWMLSIGFTVFLLLAYIGYAEYRNTGKVDNFTPTAGMIAKAAQASITPHRLTGEIPLWEDVKSSITLLLEGFTIGVVVAIVFGVYIGVFVYFTALSDIVLKIAAILPVLALLPMVFTYLGIGVQAKLFLLALATAIPLTRSIIQHVSNVEDKKIWGAKTLGASTNEIIWVVIFNEIKPKVLEDVRLLIGNAWLYLIIVELIASRAGLGYRINVASRNANMAQTMFYLFVVALLAFLIDRGVNALNKKVNKWAYLTR